MTVDAKRLARWIEILAGLAVVAVWIVVALGADRALLERDAGAAPQADPGTTLTAAVPAPPRR